MSNTTSLPDQPSIGADIVSVMSKMKPMFIEAREHLKRLPKLHRPKTGLNTEFRVRLDDKCATLLSDIEAASGVLFERRLSKSLIVSRALQLLAQQYAQAITNRETAKAELKEIRQLAPHIDARVTRYSREPKDDCVSAV